MTKRYATDNSDIEKRALVYLPKGLDKKSDKRYKTLYLMHGGGGNEEEFLFGQDAKRSLLYIIDHMIENGELEPMIIVTPSFYYEACQSVGHDIAEAATLTKAFPNEFRNELLPYIEANYPVLRGRENRAFGGFSMGGETAWEIMLNCLDLVSNFMQCRTMFRRRHIVGLKEKDSGSTVLRLRNSEKYINATALFSL